MTYQEALAWAIEHGAATRFFDGQVRIGVPVGEDGSIFRVEPIAADPVEQMRAMLDDIAFELEATTAPKVRHLVAV